MQKVVFRIFFEFLEFLSLFSSYLKRKFIVAAAHFEVLKKVFVALLLSKRGRFTRPFLHFGVGSFLAFGIIAAPVFATTYPILSQRAKLDETPSPSQVLTAYTAAAPVLVTEISPKPRDQIITYIVEKGDTLSTIAQKFDVSLDTILWENGLKSTDTLSPGQEVRILPVSGISHKVLKGDSIYSIAKKYDTDAQKIVNFPFNDFADPEAFTLIPGQVLIVPDGSPPKVRPTLPRPLPRFIAQSETTAGVEGFIWPTSGTISQRPVWYHMAVDISNKEGPAIGAAKAGKIVSSQCVKGGYGCHVVIDHGDGIQTLYGHLSQVALEAGEVAQGQVIGRMGSTGRSTGVHLHFEIRKNGVLLNPLNFLK